MGLCTKYVTTIGNIVLKGKKIHAAISHEAMIHGSPVSGGAG